MPSFLDILGVSQTSENCFIGQPSSDKAERMFGGLFLAQAMICSRQSVSEGKSIHSLHSYFLRPGDTTLPVEYRVDLVRDGRSYAHREVTAYQNEKEVFRMLCSYAVGSPGYEYAGLSSPEVLDPEQVMYTYTDFCRDQMPNEEYIKDVKARPFEIRYINPPQDNQKSNHIDNQLMWMKLNVEVEDDFNTHDAGVAYLSDSTLIDHITIPHGKRWQDDDFEGTSLDHAMWFHKSVRADSWLLFDQFVEWTGDGRGLASGRIYTKEGELAATCMQEGLMRFL